MHNVYDDRCLVFIKTFAIDWRLGEVILRKGWLDYDFFQNGGWPMAAMRRDAAPYFRIFNPYLQTKKSILN